MSDSANAFRAGLVIIIGTMIGITFYALSQKRLGENNTTAYYAYLRDAAGINAKSQVTIAGLAVGQIHTARLTNVSAGEYVVDLEARALSRLGVPASGGAVVLPNDDFDATIDDLVEKGLLPSKTTVAEQKLDAAALKPAIDKARAFSLRLARIDFVVSKEWPLAIDTWMKKGSLGLLGANALFLEPGPNLTTLKEGERLTHVRSLTSTDALLAKAQGIVADVGSITHKLDKDIGGITADIKGITGELNRFVNGDGETMPLDELYKLVMNDLRKLSNTVEAAVKDANRLINDNNGQFNKMVANIQRITSDIADLTAENGGSAGPDGGPEGPGDIRATMSSVRKISDDLTVVTSQLREVLGDDDTKQGIKELKTTIAELNKSLASLSEVAGRVERGEGTVGRLLTDEKIADKVEAAVSGASDLVTSITSLETHIDVGTWYNMQRGASTTTVGLRLQPKPDKFYLIEVTDDGGRLERLTERDTNGNVTRTSIREEDNTIRFTAMFAKQFFDFLVLRAGLIETTGGLGANLFLLDNRLELRSDIFDFRGPRNTLATDNVGFYLPRWRTLLKAQPIPHLYVSAGVDDVLNSYGNGGVQLYSDSVGYGFDYFVGVGLTFKDDDLRAILPFIPGG